MRSIKKKYAFTFRFLLKRKGVFVIEWITMISDWIWGIPMIGLLVLGGLYLTIQLGFMQVVRLPHLLKHTFMQLFKKQSDSGEGTVSPLQATTSALASTLGASNIL